MRACALSKMAPPVVASTSSFTFRERRKKGRNKTRKNKEKDEKRERGRENGVYLSVLCSLKPFFGDKLFFFPTLFLISNTFLTFSYFIFLFVRSPFFSFSYLSVILLGSLFVRRLLYGKSQGLGIYFFQTPCFRTRREIITAL